MRCLLFFPWWCSVDSPPMSPSLLYLKPLRNINTFLHVIYKSKKKTNLLCILNNVFQYSKIRTRKRNAKKSIKAEKNWNPALFGIRNPLSWNPESSTRNPESTGWNPESKTVMDSLTLGESSLPTDSSRPLFKQIENFSILTVWLYISTVSTFLNIRSSYLSASSGFRLLGEIPAGAIISCFYVTLSWKELMALLDSQAKFQKERNCQESVVSHVRELRQLFKKSKLWKGRTQSCFNSSFLKS